MKRSKNWISNLRFYLPACLTLSLLQNGMKYNCKQRIKFSLRGRDCSPCSPWYFITRAGQQRSWAHAGPGLAAVRDIATTEGVSVPFSPSYPENCCARHSLEGGETPEQLPWNLLINSAHTQHNQATSMGFSTVARFIWSYGCHIGY